jgi:hypothetical protein
MNEHQAIARKIMPYVNALSEKYGQASKLRVFDDDDTLFGAATSALKAFNRNKSRFYSDDYLVDDDEDKAECYIRSLEDELTSLLLVIYHVHKSEFDEFVDFASNLETDDIISSMMNLKMD